MPGYGAGNEGTVVPAGRASLAEACREALGLHTGKCPSGEGEKLPLLPSEQAGWDQLINWYFSARKLITN